MKRLAAVLFWLIVLQVPATAGDRFPHRVDPDALLGTQAPLLELADWINSPVLKLENLRGSVLLIRWWTDTCPFCSSSAPALRTLNATYADRGLRVIGVFHPKPPAPRTAAVERAAAGARRFGFEFPIAIDADWNALRHWWLRHYGSWTSISFVVDKRGVIRWIHPGGEYHEGDGGPHWDDHSSCNREYSELKRTIETLLAE